MNILVIGSGGREHSICDKLKQSKSCDKLFVAPGNPGIFQIAIKANISIDNNQDIINFCKSEEIDLVIIGPEQPLANGLTDVLQKHNINVFGPSKLAAKLEYSKGFAKEFMKQNNIPTAKFKQFNINNSDKAHNYIDNLKTKFVIKADGLAAGKGVIIPNSLDEAHKTIDNFNNGLFSSAGENFVIEEFLDGEEASLFVICDGEDYVILPPAQDHKRIFDNDKGLNTGGMGAIAPVGLITDKILHKIEKNIIIPLLANMKNDEMPFVGCLFIGLMICEKEPYVIEFNVRFGDPETQAVLRLINGDFAELLFSASKGKINKKSISIENGKYSCCVILASNGYPEKFEKGFEIDGINDSENNGAIVYHSGTSLINDKFITNGGRVLAVTSKENSLETAISKVYEYCDLITFKNKYYRKDIGKKGLKYI